MDLNGSSVPGQASFQVSKHPISHLDTVPRTPSQPLTAADTAILRSVESGSCGSCGGDGDDDIQIMFSIPRRRKKKRKSLDRSDSLESIAIQNRLCQRQESKSFASIRSGACPQIEQRNVNLSESTYPNRATGERRVPVGGIHISSIGPPVFRPNHNFQHTVCASTLGGIQNSDFSPLPTPWWEPSPARAFSNPTYHVDWRSVQAEDEISRKRRHPGDWEKSPQQRFHNRQSMQFSPRTNPAVNFAPLSCPPYGMGSNSRDTYERLNNAPTPQPTWPSFDWNVFNDANTNSFISQSLQQAAILTKPPAPSKVYPSHPPHQNLQTSEQLRQTKTANSWQQNGPIGAVDIDIDQMVPGPSPIAKPQKIHDQSQDMSLRTSLPNSEIQLGTHSAAALISQPKEVSRLLLERVPPRTDIPEQHDHDLDSTHNVAAIARPADIVRKPSLYKIPPWPPSLALNVPDNKGASVDAKETHASGNMSEAAAIISNDEATSLKVRQMIGLSRREHQRPLKDDDVALHNAAFRVPKARAGRKNSPNLIVDIAETCQEIFPFASVSERHNVPLKKVFDVFSAIIQLPLLRNADDRRRHGSLGKRRVKEYKDAKRAMERAQEAERKAQMKALRARVEEAGKKGKSVVGSGLAVQPNDLPKVTELQNAL